MSPVLCSRLHFTVYSSPFNYCLGAYSCRSKIHTPAVTLASCQAAHQHIYRSTPKYLFSLLQPDHNIRSLLSTRTEVEKRAIIVSAPTVWNALPSAMQLSDSAAGFQRRLKTSLFRQPDVVGRLKLYCCPFLSMHFLQTSCRRRPSNLYARFGPR